MIIKKKTGFSPIVLEITFELFLFQKYTSIKTNINIHIYHDLLKSIRSINHDFLVKA